MGLDMYLTRKTDISDYGDDGNPSPRSQLQISGPGTEHIKMDRVSEIAEDMGYWRKSNQIHAWFVQHVQDGNDDCGIYYVSLEDLQELLDTVNAVLEAYGKGDFTAGTAKANEVLPTQGGFFFGGTEYDEWYFEDLEATKAILEVCLAEAGYRGDFYYHSSW